MLARIARFSYRRRWLTVFGIWLPIMIVLAAAGGSVADYRTDFTLPNSESKDAVDILEGAGLFEQAGDTAQIVFTAEQGIDDPEVQAAMEGLFAEVDEIDGVAVTSPYSPAGAAYVSADGTIAFAELAYEADSQAEMLDLSDEIQDLGDEVQVEGLQIEYGGQLFGEFEFPPSEVLGFLAAVIILLIAFGSVVGMGLPLGTAVFGLMTGIGLVGLASMIFSMPEFSTQMAAMIGLGVGIDYALFIVTRFRENLHKGLDPEVATVRAVDTSGRAVVFAGITVMISLLGLFVVGLAFVRGMAVAGALAVLAMMFASITLLPAFLGFAGRSVEKTTRASLIAVIVWVAASIAGVATGQWALIGLGVVAGLAIWGISWIPGARRLLRTPLPPHKQKPKEKQMWWRWSRVVQHRPWPPLIGGVLLLLLLAVPLLDIRLGFGDTGNLPEDYTARKAYDLIADGFGPGYTAPLILVSNDVDSQDEAATVTNALCGEGCQPSEGGLTPADPAESGIQLVVGPFQPADGITMWQVYPTTSAQDAETEELVHHLRDDVIPSTGVDVLVGGFNAGSIDFAAYLGSRLPYLIGGVLVVSFLLLMLVFRSLLVPLKAVVMNLLSVGAAYGVIVAIFQWGWGMELIGVDKAGPVEAWAPMMLFAITFGLSMDYEVFLLSRIKEEYDRTGDNTAAVADGLAVTARVITAAALIMVCVFSSFALGYDRQLKLFGLGMAIAVLIDATIVRMVLVPSTMELLGKRNWWLPKWLDRILPHVHVEGHEDEIEERELEPV